MRTAFLLGFLGDSLTFLGAIWLARNEFTREAEFREEEAANRALEELDSVNFESKEGVALNSRAAVHLCQLREGATRAKFGLLLLSLGFSLQLAERFVD